MLNSPPFTARAPIRISTLEDFQRYGYSLAAFCDQCFRRHEFDIGELIAAGHGETSIVDLKPRCLDSGNPAQKLVSPPHLTFTGYPR